MNENKNKIPHRPHVVNDVNVSKNDKKNMYNFFLMIYNQAGMAGKKCLAAGALLSSEQWEKEGGRAGVFCVCVGGVGVWGCNTVLQNQSATSKARYKQTGGALAGTSRRRRSN